jgi:hypothetical protein
MTKPPLKPILPPPPPVKKTIVVPSPASRAEGLSRHRPISATTVPTDTESEESARPSKKQKKTVPPIMIEDDDEAEAPVTGNEGEPVPRKKIDKRMKVYLVSPDYYCCNIKHTYA